MFSQAIISGFALINVPCFFTLLGTLISMYFPNLLFILLAAVLNSLSVIFRNFLEPVCLKPLIGTIGPENSNIPFSISSYVGCSCT